MWNSADMINQSANINYGYTPHPMVSPGVNSYQCYAPNGEYRSHEPLRLTGPNSLNNLYKNNSNYNQCYETVKTEPNSWQNYRLNCMNDNMNANYYGHTGQRTENCRYNQSLSQQVNCDGFENKNEGQLSINSPGQCSLSEPIYGSPHNASSIKPPSPDSKDSPNLRKLLTKPPHKKVVPQFKHSVAQEPNEMITSEISDRKKHNKKSTQEECNLPQFHGGFDKSEDQVVKSEVAVGVAGTEEVHQSSQKLTPEPCQDVMRVAAGGDDADYGRNKMAAVPNVQVYYSWMKSGNDDKTKEGSKRTRQTYTKFQTIELEKEFWTYKYLTRDRRKAVSHFIGLTERQVKIWFQNRRMKAKKYGKAMSSPESVTNEDMGMTKLGNIPDYMDSMQQYPGLSNIPNYHMESMPNPMTTNMPQSCMMPSYGSMIPTNMTQ